MRALTQQFSEVVQQLVTIPPAYMQMTIHQNYYLNMHK